MACGQRVVMAFLLYALGFCMASGILTLPGKVNSGNALVVTGSSSSGTTGGAQALGNLPGVVDSSNRLIVKFV